MTKQEKTIVKRMKEIRDLLGEFGATLCGFDPGVSANIKGQKANNYIGFGGGYWGEHLDFSFQEWAWLEPILVELRDLRKKNGSNRE